MARTYPEVKLRRDLRALRMDFRKSRALLPHHPEYGRYRIVDSSGNSLTGDGFRLTLAEAVAWAARAKPARRCPRGRDLGEMRPLVTLEEGDALAVLRTLPTGSHQCLVTSPPYYRQRRYSDDPRELGQEDTPGEFVAKLVAVLREARRVLTDDGTAWINIGDSRSGGGGEAADVPGRPRAGPSVRFETPGVPRKSLHLVPQRLAIALLEDGWIVRGDVCWFKSQHLPDPAKDRPAACHERVLMLVKRPGSYHWDGDAVAEPAAPGSASRYKQAFKRAAGKRGSKPGVEGTRKFSGTRQLRDVWQLASGGGLDPALGDHPALMPEQLAGLCIRASTRPGDAVLDPFAGLATTGYAAARLGRRATLVELVPEFAEHARRRLKGLLVEAPREPD